MLWLVGPLSLLLTACDSLAPSGRSVRSGQVAWQVPAQGWLLDPAFDSTTAYFGTKDQQVVAVDKRSGKVRWQSSTGQLGGSPYGYNLVVAGNVVVIADYALVAFDRATGRQAWSYVGPENDGVGSFWISTNGQTIYGATEMARAYAIDVATGRQQWMAQLADDPLYGGGDAVASSPTLAGGRVFVCVTHYPWRTTGRLVALDASTGAELWSYTFQPGEPGQDAGCGAAGAVVYGTSVMIDGRDGRIFSFDQATGAVRWIAPQLKDLSNMPAGFQYGDDRPLAVAGDLVIAGSATGYLTGYDAATGAQSWQTFPWLGSIALGRIASDSATVYVRPLGGQLAAFDARTGTERWRISGENPFASAPAVDEELVYAPGFGALYGISK